MREEAFALPALASPPNVAVALLGGDRGLCSEPRDDRYVSLGVGVAAGWVRALLP